MGLAVVDIRPFTVLKDFKDHPAGRERWSNEIRAYTEIPWATPELKWSNEYWLEVERLTPITDLGPERSVKYREPLKTLLQGVHDAGYWHRDIDLINVVIHPVRGPLLIDWEGICPATGEVSYDLYGARAAGVASGHERKGPDGVWWGGGSATAPKNYWAGL